MTEAVEDVTRHLGIVTLNVPSILREFDLSESEAAASKLDTASSATSSIRSLFVHIHTAEIMAYMIIAAFFRSNQGCIFTLSLPSIMLSVGDQRLLYVCVLASISQKPDVQTYGTKFSVHVAGDHCLILF